MLATTTDSFLGGALTLEQPKTGYRAGQDPVLLAAACPIAPGQSFVDLGCGVGLIGMCLHTRVAGLRGQGIERDGALVRLALANGLNASQGDVLHEAPLPEQRVDWALSNPPFFEAGAGRPSPNAQRQAARQAERVTGPQAGLQKAAGRGLAIEAWVRAAMAWVKPRGRLGLIVSSAQVPPAMAALTPAFGGLVLKPLLGKAGRPTADRCLLFARQGSRSRFALATPLTIRAADGTLTAEAQAILAGGQPLPLPILK